MAAVDLNIQGLDELKRKLDQLSNPRKAKSIARKAARQAMNIARDTALALGRVWFIEQPCRTVYASCTLNKARSNHIKVCSGF